MATLDAHFLTGDKARALEHTCTTGDASKFDECLSETFRTISDKVVVDFVTCFCCAVKGGPHYALMQHLIDVYKIPVTRRAFDYAIQMEIPHAEKTKLLDFLFDNSDVDANTQPDGSRTFLEYCRKDVELAEYFLKRGADPNLGTRRGFPSGSYWGRDHLLPNTGVTLAHAILWGTIEVVQLLIQYGAKLEYAGAVHYAVERGEEEMLTKVLELGGNIEEVNHAYINYKCLVATPLYRAVKQGKLNMVEILLKNGASVLGKGGDELTSYDRRCRNTKKRDKKGDLITPHGNEKVENDTTVLELVMMEGIDEQIRDAVLEAAEPEYEFVVVGTLSTELH